MADTPETPASGQAIGPKILLEGPSGTGKTYSIGTAIEWAEARKIPCFVLFTENGLETLLGYWADRGKPIPPNLAWAQTLTRPIGLNSLITAADAVGNYPFEMITKITDSTRGQNNAYKKILQTCAKLTDERTGQSFGPLEQQPPEFIFVIDSLTELANAAMKMTIGNKPTASPNEYGMAQNNLMNFLRLITQGCACTFIMTAHIDRLNDEITGLSKIMTKAIGKAIAGDIPPLFSDVILTVREGTQWTWDTANAMTDLKTRNLPIAAKLVPNFSTILDKWASRMAAKSKSGA